MPLLNRPGEDPINFIHIPRTGGRWVVELLLANGFDFTFPAGHKYYFSNVIDGHEVMHFHAELMEKHFEIDGVPSFSVVRDPVERFISASPALMPLLNEHEDLQDFLTRALTFENNWFRPQKEFLLQGTSVWRFENGLNESFVRWLNNKLNLDLEHRAVMYTKIGADKNKIHGLTEDDLETIRAFYSADYAITG